METMTIINNGLLITIFKAVADYLGIKNGQYLSDIACRTAIIENAEYGIAHCQIMRERETSSLH